MSEIRTNLLKSERGDASPSAPFGLRVSGVSTTTTLNVTGNATISGNLGVAGTITYEDVARVDATGISTFREGFKLGPITGVALTAYNDGSIRSTGIITATSYYGDGSNLTGISAGTSLSGSTDNTVCTVTGANAIQGESNVRIDSTGRVLIGATTEGAATADELTIETAGSTGMTIRSGTSGEGNIFFSDGTSGNDEYRGIIRYEHANNAMVVKVDTAERLRINSGGKVLYGDHSNDRGAQLQYEGSQHECIGIHRNDNSHGAPAMVFSASRGTSAGSNTIVQSGDYLGMLTFKGTDGSNLASGAFITAIVDGTPGSNDMPARLGLWTAPDGTESPEERLRISAVGDIDFAAGNTIGGSASGLVWQNNGSSDSHRLFTTPKTKGGTILGRYQYTHVNQGQNYWHDIRSPGGGNYLASYATQNYYTEIYITVAGTGTSDAYCKYRHYQNSDDNSATLNHIHGNSSTNSNRPYMRLNGQVPQWAMDHSGNYTMTITVDFVGGGRNNGTYTTRYGSYAAN